LYAIAYEFTCEKALRIWLLPRQPFGMMLMNRKTYCTVAGIIFTTVALFHLMRIYMEWRVVIGDWAAPKSLSWAAFIVAGGLALFGFRFAASDEH
jgi:hypothetical protein